MIVTWHNIFQVSLIDQGNITQPPNWFVRTEDSIDHFVGAKELMSE